LSISLKRDKMRRVLYIITILLFVMNYTPVRIEAFPGDKITKAAGEGVVWTAKGAGKTIYWTGKGMYKVAEFIVVEAFRPIKAITNKMVDIWGVSVEE